MLASSPLRRWIALAALLTAAASPSACGGSDSDITFKGTAGSSSGTGGTAPLTPANCGDLVACCLELTGEERKSCQSVATAFASKGDDTSCASALAGYQKTNGCTGVPTNGEGGATGTGGAGGAGGGPDQGDAGGPDQGDAGGPNQGGAAGSGPSVATEAEACAIWAASFCERQETCGPVAFHAHYENGAQCRSAEASIVCPLLYFGQSTFSPDGVAACGSDYAKLTCDQLAGVVLPSSCRPPPGLRPEGGSCASSADCASALCDAAPLSYLHDEGEPIGRCVAPGQAGAKCTVGRDCVSLRCNSSKGVCLDLEENPASCGDRFDCALGWGCTNGKCIKPGLAGAPCVVGPDSRCGRALGFVCTKGACAAAPVHAAGSACNLGDVCAYGSYCQPKGLISGTCDPQAGEGEKCTPSFSGIPLPSCRYPLGCDAQTSTCKVPILPP